MKTGAVLLAGGQSRRMGRDKASLPLSGGRFLDRIAAELAPFGETLLSVAGPAPAPPAGFLPVQDRYPGCGPVAGLHAALLACRADAILAVACDLPLFHRDLGLHLFSRLEDGHDAVVPVTRDGRIHPFCAVYRRTLAPLLERHLQSGSFRMRDVLSEMAVQYVSLADTPYPDRCLSNVNTPEEYAALSGRKLEDLL